MRVFLAFVAAFVTALNVYLYSRVVDLSARVQNAAPPTQQLIVKEVERSKDMPQDLALKLIQSTVRVTRVGEPGNGTGIVIYSKQVTTHGYYHFILTAGHVVGEGQMSIEKFGFKESKYIEVVTTLLADTLFVDREMDVALLRVWDAVPFPVVPELVGEEDIKSMRLFERLHVIGCPLGAIPFETTGNLSAINVLGKHVAFTAPVMFGNSGGPVFTADGKLFAMVKMMARTPGGQAVPHMGFGVPSWRIEEFLKANGLGFVTKANDGSSFEKLDKILKEKAEAEKAQREEAEAEKRKNQEELKKALEEFMRKLKIEDPEAQPK